MNSKKNHKFYLFLQDYAIADINNPDYNQNGKTLVDEITALEEEMLKIRDKLSPQMVATYTELDERVSESKEILQNNRRNFINKGSDLYISYQQKIVNIEKNLTDAESICIGSGKVNLSSTLYAHMIYGEYFIDEMVLTVETLDTSMRPTIEEGWIIWSEIYNSFKACSNLNCYKEELKRAQDFEKYLDSGLYRIKPKIFLDIKVLDSFLQEFTAKKLAVFFFQLNAVYKEIQKCKIPLP